MPRNRPDAKCELAEILKSMSDVWQLQGHLIQSALRKVAAPGAQRAGAKGRTGGARKKGAAGTGGRTGSGKGR